MKKLTGKSHRSLELNKVLEMLANEAVCDDAKNRCLTLSPATDLLQARALQQQTSDACTLAQRAGYPSFSGVRNITGALRRADLGSSMSFRELLDTARLLAVIRGLKNYRAGRSELHTSLDALFAALSPEKSVEERIEGSILSEEEMADGASPLLYSIRQKMRRANEKIRESLNHMIRSPAYSKALQEPIITQRDGRYVIPVKSGNRSDIAGLVHDVSASGATFFIEPMAVVEANNELRVLRGQEEDEVDRITAELSAMVAAIGAGLEADYQRVVNLDCIFSRARLAEMMRAVCPRLEDSGQIELKKARHPLIERKKVVPIDVSLGGEHRTLVITGPNTGGKTVTLKTIGLLTLMAQCGLHIPAQEESVLSVFSQVFADIGDEQSIEQSLSTFSSHMSNIVEIIALADRKTLVLFDELGSGTDPIEGAALAITILEEMGTKGAVTAATTHYMELKLFAMRTPGVQNASCEFDIETLQPTYRLITGIPGKSSAFAISQRLGFPPRLIQRASELIGEKDRKVEDVLSRLEKNRRELEEQTALAQQLDQDARQAREEALQERERVRQESDKELDRARIQARRIVEQAKLLYNRLSDEMEQIKKSYLDAQTARDLSERRRAAKRLLGEMEDAADPIARRCNDSYSLPRELRIGDSVLLHQYNTVGTVVSLPDKSGKVGIQAGTMNITVDEKELRLEPEKSRKGPVRSESFSAAELRMQTLEAKTDLDIRGQNAEEGLLELDAFLDNAALGGIPTVMVIHGKGTGVLRKAVQNHLKNHPLVKSYRNGKYGEGEMGVTVVEMK